MTAEQEHPEIKTLLTALLDGEMTPELQQRLNQLVQTSPQNATVVVDHLLMDSLLGGELGPDSMTAVVDMLSNSESECTTISSPLIAVAPSRLPADRGQVSTSLDSQIAASTGGRLARSVGWLLSVAVAAVLLVMLIDSRSSQAFANASDVIQAAVQAHDSGIERVYSVSTRKKTLLGSGFKAPDDVRVYTQGSEFWVQMNDRSPWSWGRQIDGTIWLAAGRSRAMKIAPEEIGPPLHDIAELYSVNWEALLLSVLDDFDLKKTETESTYEIVAEPRPRNRRWIRRIRIVIDRETKAVRELVLNRRLALFGESVMTFQLLDAHTADESLYRLEGHVDSDARIYTQDTRPDPRRSSLVKWFGSHARRWIIAPDDPDAEEPSP